MKTLGWLVMLAALSGVTENISFDTAPLGKIPSGWSVPQDASTPSQNWEVVRDPSAPTKPYVFASDGRANRPPVAILEQPALRDGEISVRFKPLGAAQEQAAGLVWRYRDARNYYLVHAKPAQKQVALYKVENGRHIRLTPRGPRDGRHQLRTDSWNILKVAFKGSVFSVYCDHRRVLQVVDRTFEGPGKVGLWTKADSVTYFDNFRLVKKQ
jgi:hypothetical protein